MLNNKQNLLSFLTSAYENIKMKASYLEAVQQRFPCQNQHSIFANLLGNV